MALVGRTMPSAFLQFDVDYEQAKQLPIGAALECDAFAAGGHMWKVKMYPRGRDVSDNGAYASIFFQLVNRSATEVVNAIFEAFFMDNNGQPSPVAGRSSISLFDKQAWWGWPHFISVADLENHHVSQGRFRFMCAIMVISDSSIPVPDSDIGKHLGTLVESAEGSDVSFIVDGQAFHAHRAVLAARSPVFKAELLGSMAEASMSSITLHGIAPAIFRIMLRFMYTDVLPEDDELGDSPTQMLSQLLAASDRYALDRLKLFCASKLWDNVSANTVSSILIGSDVYGCLELKEKCLDFILSDDASGFFFTDDFLELVQKYPHLIAELRRKVNDRYNIVIA